MAKAKKAAKAAKVVKGPQGKLPLKRKGDPGHYTDKGTRKYQANGPVLWSKTFQKAAGKDGREGEGIRWAMAYAIAHEDKFLAWVDGTIENMKRMAAKAEAKESK